MALFGGCIFALGKVPQQFSPDSSRPEILVDLWLPEGSTQREIEALARRFEARMLKEPGLESVTSWIGSGVPRFHLPLNPIFPQSNVSPTIAQTSRTGLSGATAGQYREGDKRVDIVLRQPLEDRKVMTDLDNAYVPTSNGRSIPLAQIARIELGWEPGVLWR